MSRGSSLATACFLPLLAALWAAMSAAPSPAAEATAEVLPETATGAENEAGAPIPPGAAKPEIGVFLQGSVNKYLAGQSSEFGNLAERPATLGFNHAELALNGRPASWLGYHLRLDFSPSGSPGLDEGLVALQGRALELAIGRIRAPLGAEFLTGDWALPAISRARYLQAAIDPSADPRLATPFGAITDSAIRGAFSPDDFSVSAWAGSADMAARAEFRPDTQARAGLFYLAPNPLLKPIDLKGEQGANAATFHDRWGADASWRLGPVLLATEYLRGYQADDLGGCFSQGILAYALWDVAAGHQALLRYETFAPEYRYARDSVMAAALTAAARFQTAIVGWNILLPGQASRLQIQYSHDFRPGGRDADYLAAALGIRL